MCKWVRFGYKNIEPLRENAKRESVYLERKELAIVREEGRVEGAIMMGNRWFISQNSLKPEDKRRAKNITDCGGNPHG